MATLVQSKIEFERIKTMLFDRISDAEFENNPFNERFKYFVGFEFDFIYHESFFVGLKMFLRKIDNETVIFYTIDPPPDKYFYKHFEKYSVFEISNIATDEELTTIMTQEPIENSADSICISSDEIAWFSKSKEWAILGSREWEIAVVGFATLETKLQFLESFSEDAKTMFTSLQVQAEALDEMLCFNGDAKKAYQNLVENYRDRATQ